MTYYMLIYEVVDDYISRRAAFREEHLSHAEAAAARGELLLGGAFADPADRAVMVFRAKNASVVEEFARQDPYVRKGLVKKWNVRPWTVVVGASAHPPR